MVGFSQIKESRLYPVLLLEDTLSHRARHKVIWLVEVVLVLLLGLLATAALFDWADWPLRLFGLFLLFLIAFILLEMLEAYFRSFYFGSIITNEYQPQDLFSFTVGRILYLARDGDWLRAFLRSRTGHRVMRRLGIGEDIRRDFWARRSALPPEGSPLSLPAGEVLRLRGLVEFLYKTYPEFAELLSRFELEQGDLLAATGWVVQSIEREAVKERWWSYDNLMRVPGLAKDWAYGGIYTLEKYSRDLLTEPQARPSVVQTAARAEEVRQIETILLRSRETNVLLLGDAGESKMEVVWQLARELRSGRVAPALEGNRLVLLNSALLLSAFKEKNLFEKEVIRVFSEAARAGNVLLAIDNLPGFILGAESLEVDLPALLKPYLSSTLPIIALADTDQFHQYLEGRTSLVRLFERVWARPSDFSSTTLLLQGAAEELEKKYRVWFTYPAIAALSRGAEQYFQGEAPADKALDLLVEIVPWARSQDKQTVGRVEAEDFLAEKTGVPLGKITAPEKEKLLNLENLLHERVIGQEAAINAVSQAMRRSRTGIRNPNKPIGSFLFFGPTGVGKTETAKALAAVFFDNERSLLRLDMSEFQAADALPRLIGSFADNKPGILTNLLRQNSYGVLLLDEFEKTHRDVLNLFLQILDEGFFADMLGKRVNARNIIFIATSNAGAELIWEMVGRDEDPSQSKDKLVNHLVSQTIFRPELLNRFDDIVVYHPLRQEDLREIARLLLGRLVSRLQAKGIALLITDELVEAVISGGYNKLFGARPMLRFIQSSLEERVASALIRGEVAGGSKIKFDQGLNLVRLP